MLKFMKVIVLGFLVLSFFASDGFAVTMNGTVRVCLSSLENPSELHLKTSGNYTIGEDGPGLVNGISLLVQSSGQKLVLSVNGRVQAEGSTIVLRRHIASGENGLRIQEARYPSNLYPCDLELTMVDNGIRAVAQVYIEDYLLGVLPYEMDGSFPTEALKAQAVAARSYVLRKMSLNSRLYDVVDTTADQVYYGTPSINDRCLKAVLETWGLVGYVNNQLMPGFYTASNGGQTETVKNAWGGSDYDFLPLMDDPYDLKNPLTVVRSVSFYKSGKTSCDSLTALLNSAASRMSGKQSVRIEKIVSVELVSPRYNEPSKVYSKVRVKLLLSSGETATVLLDYADEVEKTANLSINVLNNEVLSVTEDNNAFILSARRFGHGVGLSQRGAQQMAEEGFEFSDILRFYYPGIELREYEMSQRLLGSSTGTNNGKDVLNYDSEVLTVSSGNLLDFLCLREQPSPSGKILKMLTGGVQVVLLQYNDTWSMVQSGLTVGYIESAFLHETQKADRNAQGSQQMIVVLDDENQSLNVRSAPTVYSQVIGSLRNGEKAELLVQYADWSCIQCGVITGYVRNQFLKIYKEEDNSGSSTSFDYVLPGMKALVLPAEGAQLYADHTSTAFVYLLLPQGTQLKVTGVEIDGMIPVALGGLAGFVDSGMLYITVTEEQSSVAVDSDSENVEEWAEVIAVSGLKLRQTASASGQVLLTMPYMAKVRLIERFNDDFWNIEYNGNLGFAASRYLSVIDSSSNLVDNADKMVRQTAAPTTSPASSRIIKPSYAVITAENGVNLRSGPSGNDSAITVLGYGLRVNCTGEVENGYCHVSIGSLSGYVSADFLQFQEESSTDASGQNETEWKDKRAMVISRNGLNLRAQPNSGSASYYVLPYGTVLEVLDKTENGFYLVGWSGYKGYVSASFVQLLGE